MVGQIHRASNRRPKNTPPDSKVAEGWSTQEGGWGKTVGYFNYHAVPGNIDSLQSFRAQVVWHWSRALQRRSQKSRMPWERFGPLVARWIPSGVILHPRPAMRFNARYLR